MSGELYKAYIPANLPPELPIDLTILYPYLEKATLAEGTQSSFSDLMLFEHNQKPKVSIEDVEEISNYIKAINYGLKRLKKDMIDTKS